MARQQVANENNQVVDAPVTSKDHPLVKYADEFTKNFDNQSNSHQASRASLSAFGI